ncbi:hydroxyethylthiazole kinase [Gracilibacillus marinus]|jgi:hydroxyethylthiazole kinase|uniref:Hydroxyethylthiazole kinase n=1 Tax=Gracilibacillus marinus TaxID=630535 RepID=A0ABV8VUD1_9BACI
MSHILAKVREQSPLIHNITNQVVTNFTANGLYALGASPVMANAPEEVEEMASIANALVLNIGTLTKEQVHAMILAGKIANKRNIPVVLDPVGVGATTFRTEKAKEILQQVQITVIRGNASEIATLAGIDAEVKGVDTAGSYNMEELIRVAYQNLGVPIIITGQVDYITDGDYVTTVSNGHELLTKVTGAGCLLSSVVAAFLAVEEDVVQASSHALSYYGVVAQNASQHATMPGDFQIELLNQLYAITSEEVDAQSIIATTKLERGSI